MGVYSWKPGARVRTDPNVAGSVCEELSRKGNLTAKGLVDVSRPEDAPLHPEFEWDDYEAAERWREQQARKIIQSLIVVSESNMLVRKFVNISISTPVYEDIDVVIRNEEKRQSLLDMAKRDLEIFRHKYSTLKELSDLFEEIEKVFNYDAV